MARSEHQPPRKRANGLVALGAVAVMTVYSAGYVRTREAAEKLESGRRRPPIPAPPESGPENAVTPPTSNAVTPQQARVNARRARGENVPDPEPVAIKVPDPAAAPKPVARPKVNYKDGTYVGWGTSRHGDIEATVVIQGGRITSTEISNCQTRYPCNVIKKLPPQVVTIQSAEVDFITGATESTYALYYAVVEALSKAR